MKYSIVRVGITFSTRTGMSDSPLWTARSTSRCTWTDLLEASLKTSSMTREPSMASMIDSAHGTPGTMSRGAIQHGIPRCSRPAQIAFEATASFDA